MSFPEISSIPFGIAPDGAATLWTLSNSRGLSAQITNYGGVSTSLRVPDKHYQSADIVLGYDNFEDYLQRGNFFGALVGRYANRIAGGRFSLDGKEVQLSVNEGKNHIHGGKIGFDKRIWQAREVEENGAVGLELTLQSADGEEGYPGNLEVRVTYWLGDDLDLRLEYEATCDQTTVLCLTNHSYFNLAGAGSGDILGHELTLEADAFTPVDAGKIPTGEIRAVAGTPFDFRSPKAIGQHIEFEDEQIQLGGGYDHNFVLRGETGSLKRAAQVAEPQNGRVMEVWTTEPGVQLYSGNGFRDGVRGKSGQNYGFRSGFCLETQHYPDSPNQKQFPTTVLRPGQTYRQTTIYAFSTR